MAKKTEPEEDRIFKPPKSPHFQTADDRNVWHQHQERL
jgi:hypothetical protein